MFISASFWKCQEVKVYYFLKKKNNLVSIAEERWKSDKPLDCSAFCETAKDIKSQLQMSQNKEEKPVCQCLSRE